MLFDTENLNADIFIGITEYNDGILTLTFQMAKSFLSRHINRNNNKIDYNILKLYKECKNMFPYRKCAKKSVFCIFGTN